MKNKAVSLFICSLLTVLFCLFLNSTDIKASNGSIQTNGNNYTSSLTIPTNSTWNQVMSSAGQNAQPSSACTGYYVAFGYKCADNDICYQTVYFAEPSTYADLSHTQGATYDGVTYNLRYPVAFVNWYPIDVSLPDGREFINNSYRSCYYPTPTGRMLEGAFIVGAGEDILYLTNYSDGNAQQAIDPLSENKYSFQYASLWWDNYIPSTSATTPFIFTQPNRNLWQGVIDNSLWCTHADCPVFCDLYEALKYSETGIIDDNNRQYVLYGAESAAVIPTPTITITPTPTPIPQITGSVSINGEVIIGNWPTATPTPSPTPTPTPVPYGDIFDDNVSDGGAISITGIDSSGLKEDVKNSIEISDGFMPLHYPLEEVPGYTNGDSSNVFNNYPKAAMNYLTTAQTGEDSSFVTFLIHSTGIFSNSASSFGFGVNTSSPLFWFLSAIVLMVFVTVLKKIL